MTRSYLGADGPLAGSGLESLLGDDALIWQVWDVVDRLDLTAFEAGYRRDSCGGQPYDPRLMVAAILWCYRWGIRSPAGIAEACHERVQLCVMLGGRTPGQATVRRFIRQHARAWHQVRIAVLALCARADLVDIEITATDGSPVGANAALSSNRSLAWVDEHITLLEADLAEVTAHQIAATQALDTDADVDIEVYCDDICDTLRHREARLLRQLSHLRAARHIAATRAAERAATGVAHPDRVRKLRARADRQDRQLTQMIAAQQAKLDARAARDTRDETVCGPRPVAIADSRHITGQQKRLERTRQHLAAAEHSGQP